MNLEHAEVDMSTIDVTAITRKCDHDEIISLLEMVALFINFYVLCDDNMPLVFVSGRRVCD